MRAKTRIEVERHEGAAARFDVESFWTVNFKRVGCVIDDKGCAKTARVLCGKRAISIGEVRIVFKMDGALILKIEAEGMASVGCGFKNRAARAMAVDAFDVVFAPVVKEGGGQIVKFVQIKREMSFLKKGLYSRGQIIACVADVDREIAQPQLRISAFDLIAFFAGEQEYMGVSVEQRGRVFSDERWGVIEVEVHVVVIFVFDAQPQMAPAHIAG